MSRFDVFIQKTYDEYIRYFHQKLKVEAESLPKPILNDTECIRRARQYTFDTSRKYMSSRPNHITEEIQRGLDLLQTDSRFQNKKVVAEIKTKNNEIKKKNRELQRISRAYLRDAEPSLEYDFTRWDIVPRRIYEEAEYQYNLETMHNPIIKWVINKN